MKIGTDIIQINRIETLIDKYDQKFKHKYLSTDEIKLAKKVETYAGFWAAKEAIAKALGCGIGSALTFHDIIISKNAKGAPYFILTDHAQQTHQIVQSSLSISHDGGFAIAVVAITTSNIL